MTKMGAKAPLEDYQARRETFHAEAEGLDRSVSRYALVQLGLFVAVVVFGGAGISQGSYAMLGAGLVLLLLFAVVRLVQTRAMARRDLAQIRRDVHGRHVKRLDGTWLDLPYTGAGLLESDHPYAFDIDLLGPGSLFQRIDVTHTLRGEQTLVSWLGEAATKDIIEGRQRAVEELTNELDLRQELEAAVGVAKGDGKLDAEPFLQFTQQSPFLAGKAWLVGLAHVLPLVTVGLLIASSLGLLPAAAWLAPLIVQGVVVLMSSAGANRVFELVAARRGFFEAYHRLLEVAEGAELEAEVLVDLKKRLSAEGVPPSVQMRRLDRWAGFADLRTQVLFHLPVNFLLLWDLNILYRLERWNREIGSHMGEVFDALGELEALCSLATLRGTEPESCYPEIGDEQSGFEAEGLAHPLLHAESRVANDVGLGGPGTALIVTGSNMAGKSTLLRSVGINVALALAGAPVCARRMTVPPVRLRASMRAADDLQRGASYFHAELTKLRNVVTEAEAKPPVFFLLDELLRGTNAHARHIGARGVLMHLLERNATGLVATHDVALSELQQDHPDRVHNAHFTDVVIDGEMTFDYRLQPGVVRTSNALRLLRMAGIDVPDDDTLGR